MAILSINGLDIAVADAHLTQSRELVGGKADERSPHGVLQDHQIAIKRKWSVSTAPMAAADGLALKHWLIGEGHVIPFALNHQALDGLSPSTMVDGKLVADSILGRSYAWNIGPHAASPSTDIIKYPMAVGTAGPQNFSMTCWYKSTADTGGVWKHMAFVNVNGVSDSYVDGVASGNPLDFYTVSSSLGGPAFWVVTHTFRASRASSGTLDTTARIAELCLFPFSLSADQVAALAARTRSLPGLPVMEATGDMLRTDAGADAIVNVRCTDVTVDFVAGSINGSFSPFLHSLRFNMVEV